MKKDVDGGRSLTTIRKIKIITLPRTYEDTIEIILRWHPSAPPLFFPPPSWRAYTYVLFDHPKDIPLARDRTEPPLREGD